MSSIRSSSRAVDRRRLTDDRLRLGQRLDQLSARVALVVGLGLGGMGGGVVLLAGPMPQVLGGVAFVALLGGAALLAHSGRPVVIEAPRPTERGGTSGQAESSQGAEQPEPEPLVALADIPGRSFLMGSPEDEKGRVSWEGPRHEVWVPGFRLMRTLVTRRLYREIMGSDPGWPEGEADERPVNNVTWLDAVAFCQALSEREGIAPAYTVDGDRVTRAQEPEGYRLPTEAEWEYACRAGTTSRWSFGGDEAALGDHAWYRENSGGQPQPVATREPNRWGLYDMHGNLWEWVEDCWHEDHSGAPTDGSAWLEGDCMHRVVRGGSFGYGPRGVRSASRCRGRPEDRDDYQGFRCARAARH